MRENILCMYVCMHVGETVLCCLCVQLWWSMSVNDTHRLGYAY